MEATSTTTPKSSKGIVIGSWIARVIVAVIFTIGAIPKLIGLAGALADVLPGGYPMVIVIAVAEVAAVVLILTPAAAFYGALLASLVMLGAIGSHLVGPVGMEGDAGSMFPMAVIAFLAAVASAVLLKPQPAAKTE